MRGVAILVMMTACWAEPKTQTVPPAPPTAVGPWWCLSLATSPAQRGEIGKCEPSQAACAVMRANLMASRESPGEELSECTQVDAVACFDAASANGSRALCHPTMAMCRSHVDHFTDPGEQAINECRMVGAGVAADASDHWWCMSFHDGTIGSCDRARESCNADRSYVAKTFGETATECAPYPTAMCAEITNPQGHHLECAPTAALCASMVKTQQEDPNTTATECRPHA